MPYYSCVEISVHIYIRKLITILQVFTIRDLTIKPVVSFSNHLILEVSPNTIKPTNWFVHPVQTHVWSVFTARLKKFGCPQKSYRRRTSSGWVPRLTWVHWMHIHSARCQKLVNFFEFPTTLMHFVIWEKSKCINTDAPIAIKISLLESKLKNAVCKILSVT